MNIIKLKQIRKSKGYTLSKLSSMTGCTSSHLSQLERGLKQPSLEMLRRISNCLEVPIFDLLSEDETSEAVNNNANENQYEVIRCNNRKKFVIPEILSEYEFVTPYSADKKDNTRIVGMLTTLMPGKWSCEKSVTLDYDFSIFIIQGTATAYIGKDTLELNKGDSIYIFSKVQHNFYNAGNSELIMVGYAEREDVDS